MARPVINLTGKKYNSLLVIKDKIKEIYKWKILQQ